MKRLLSFLFTLALCLPAVAQTKSIVTPLATTSTDNGLLRYDGTTGQLVQAATGMTYSDNRALTIGGATLTVASEPILNLSQTWNNAAVTFTGLKLNVTDTASASGSLLMDLQVDGVSRISASKAGDFTASNTVRGNTLTSTGGTILTLSSLGYVGFGNPLDLFIQRDAAATLQMGQDAAAATAQKLKAHDGSGTDKSGADMTVAAGIGTGTASGGSLYLQTGGVGGASGSSLNTLTNRVTIGPVGNVTIAAPSSGTGLTISGGGASVTGNITLTSTANAVSFGGGASSISGPAASWVRVSDNGSNPIVNFVSGGYIQGRAASGTDVAGYQVNIQGGPGTGTGAGGAVLTQTALSGSTGSSTNSMSTREYYSAKPVTLTESAATTIATIAVGSSKYVGAKLFVTVNAADATDFQALSATLNVNAVNKAGTVTPTITQVDGTTAASAGTLTATYSVTTSGNNVIVQCNAVSSLTQTTLAAKWSIETLNSDDTAAVTVP